ncbi:MAG: NYN domain-containing protein [Alphaproteobacteria bacterium]
MARSIPGGKFYEDERVAIFIDGANLYAAARSLGFDIDYKKLLELFRLNTRLVRAFYYTALVEDQEYSPIRPLVDWLDYNGYTMVTKPTKEFTDATGRRKIKGNMDIELATDVMEIAERVDHVVIFSGDGDFRRLVEAVQRKGVRVSIVSTIRSQPPMVADELRRQADVFVELEQLADSIRRSHAGRPDNREDRRTAARPAVEEDEYDEDDEDLEDDEYYDDEDDLDDEPVR